MSRIRLLAISVCILVWDASEATAPVGATAELSESWRQTSQGWEHVENLFGPKIEYRRPALHPAVVGSLELLLTMMAMLAFSGDTRVVGAAGIAATETRLCDHSLRYDGRIV